MWQSAQMRPPYGMHDIEITEPLAPITLAPQQGGAHVLIRHRGRPVGRLWINRVEHGALICEDALAPMVAQAASGTVAALAVRDALLGEPGKAPTPPLTVAVCTRNRPDLLRRCLASLVAVRDARLGFGPAIDILVVDNAPTDGDTQRVTAGFAGARYAVEPIPGLDFGRNRALASTDHPWLAFIDDDAVVDRLWLDRLAEAIAASPEAGCFTGPVMPLMLETEAQLRFEHAGGFGRGFQWGHYGPERWDDPIYPGAGFFGTGACMVLSTAALHTLGGFDEALDTGPPLPGGGDLDIFYRVVRGGYRLVYVPGLLVHHEHRRDMPGLAKQYHSWGLSVMALVRKNQGTDPEMRAQRRRLLLWWLSRKLRALVRALLGRGPQAPALVLAEIRGAVKGYLGEYQRSQSRVAARRREYGT